MSTGDRKTAAPAERPAGPRGPMGHRGPMGMAMPVAKAMDFRGSLRRVLGELRPERVPLIAVVALTVVSVVAMVFGPKVLGRATDVIFAGVVGRMLPAGVSQAQAVQGLRAQGQTKMADMLAPMKGVVPGQGIDFTALGRVLVLVLALYVGSWLFGYLQGLITTGAVQRTVYRMRQQVETKLGRVPLSYVDQHARGELLSRVTNDIDNLAQTLQQTLSQLINAALTIIGVLIMMFWISPLLAAIALVTLPAAGVVTMFIAKRAQPQFVAQWKRTGTLNAHVEEMYTGHALVKVFGRQRAASQEFHEQNSELYEASFKAQFISGVIQPAMMFIANLNYVAIAVVGGLRVASGAITLGDVQAFIQYSRQFSHCLLYTSDAADDLT